MKRAEQDDERLMVDGVEVQAANVLYAEYVPGGRQNGVYMATQIGDVNDDVRIPEVVIHNAEVEARISRMVLQFFKEDTTSARTKRQMSERRMLFWRNIINKVSRSWLFQRLSQKWLGVVARAISAWMDRSGFSAASTAHYKQHGSKPIVSPEGGYIFPPEYHKNLMRQYNFIGYWQWEGRDLAALIRRLEEWRG